MANYMPETAFRLTQGKKRPRIKTEGYLDFVRQLPCCNCLKVPVEAAHIRFTCLAAGKPQTGAGRKPDDRWAVPLCPTCHRDQHVSQEVFWWHGVACIDPIYLAAVLFGHFIANDLAAAKTTITCCRDLGRYR